MKHLMEDYPALNRLQAVLRGIGTCTVAVSGGIDSMLLAFVAQRMMGDGALIGHACSAAVPKADTLRVNAYAERYGWRVAWVDTGEMSHDAYRANPVNRCYYCKSCLYQRLRSLDCGQVVSGTNLDDLDDYRPGLIAAREQEIRHPYIEAGVDKTAIRHMARLLKLTDLQDLPASPCLSSRVETGINIDPRQLGLIERVEAWARAEIPARTIRLRVRRSALVLELDSETLAQLTPERRVTISACIAVMADDCGLRLPVALADYRRGAAFVGDKAAPLCDTVDLRGGAQEVHGE
ncbi:hypothetical protein ACL2XP_08995 [Sodalis sp. RH21]|uniref:hypothetical protein n=1 Tax=unclassified Sodalis (in: enterobacteria) TaxID=2636512 RepID=UPI0039B58A5C